jgi:hypothetical protein
MNIAMPQKNKIIVKYAKKVLRMNLRLSCVGESLDSNTALVGDEGHTDS